MENINKGKQKIKCNVNECAYNSTKDCVCTLKEIAVCNCSLDKTKDPLKDTACGSYKYKEEKNK